MNLDDLLALLVAALMVVFVVAFVVATANLLTVAP